MQNPLMIILAQTFVDKSTVELLVNAGALTLVMIFALALVGAAIMLIRMLGNRGKGNEEALQTMSAGFSKSQSRIDELQQELDVLKSKSAEQAGQWVEVVKNSNESLKQVAEAMNTFASKNAEWRKEQIDLQGKAAELQQVTIDRIEALNLNFITWPKSTTETARIVTDELKVLQDKVEQLPQDVVEALRPVLIQFQNEIEQRLVRFKSEPETTDALD